MDKSGETCNARHHRSYHRSYYDDTWYTNQQVNDDTWYFHLKKKNYVMRMRATEKASSKSPGHEKKHHIPQSAKGFEKRTKAR